MSRTHDDQYTINEIMRGPERERVGRYCAWLARAYLPPNVHAIFMSDLQTLVQLAYVEGAAAVHRRTKDAPSKFRQGDGAQANAAARGGEDGAISSATRRAGAQPSPYNESVERRGA